MSLPSEQKRMFQKIVWKYYAKHKRDFPWRHTVNPYGIVVSEIMLQQTHVARVLEKYQEFMRQFPSFRALAEAPQGEVLRMWRGLGYNRRALNLHRLAKIVREKHHGRLPRDFEALKQLPGIGSATAASIRAFSFNEATPFIETNIRSVFIHFLRDTKAGLPVHCTQTGEITKIKDREILKLVEETLDWKNPREWYWALMDYGTHLKKTCGNPNRFSAHYAKQSSFEGSNRQIRGAILKALTETPLDESAIAARINVPCARVKRPLAALLSEGFIRRRKNMYRV